MHPALDSEVLDQLVAEAIALIAAEKLEAAEALAVELSLAAPAAPAPAWLVGACRLRRNHLTAAVEAFGEAIQRARAARDPEAVQLAHLGRAEARVKLGHRFLAGIDLEIAAGGADAALSARARATAASIRLRV